MKFPTLQYKAYIQVGISNMFGTVVWCYQNHISTNTHRYFFYLLCIPSSYSVQSAFHSIGVMWFGHYHAPSRAWQWKWLQKKCYRKCWGATEHFLLSDLRRHSNGLNGKKELSQEIVYKLTAFELKQYISCPWPQDSDSQQITKEYCWIGRVL